MTSAAHHQDASRHTHTVTRRFSAAADTYDAHADIQRKVVLRLADFLDKACEPKRVLEVGCGSGQLTRVLVERYPLARIQAVDISARMVHVSRNTFGDRVQFTVRDASQLEARPCYDLVASSSSLHWMAPIDKTVQRLADLLAPGGRFIAAVMLNRTLGELRTARLKVAPSKPPLGRLPESGEVLSAIEKADLVLEKHDDEILTGSYTSAEGFLQSIHEQGLTGGDVSRAHTPLTRGELDRLVRLYHADHRDEDGRVVATFRLLYVSARKPGSAEGVP